MDDTQNWKRERAVLWLKTSWGQESRDPNSEPQVDTSRTMANADLTSLSSVSKLWSTVSTHGLGRYSSEREGASGGRLEANMWPIQWEQPACVYFMWRRLRGGEHLAFFPFEVWCWLLRFPQVLASWMDGEGVLKRWVVMTLEMYTQGSREHRETQQFCWIWRPGGGGAWGA